MLTCLAFKVTVVAVLTVAPFHKFPDNYVDRTLSIVVRDDRAIVEFSAGMNDNTIETVLDLWNQPDSAKSSVPSSENETVQSNAEIESGETGGKELPNPNPELEPDQAIAIKDENQQSTTVTTPATSEVDPENKDTEDDFKNDAELAQQLREQSSDSIHRLIAVTCNGQPVTLIPIEETFPVRRHMSCTVRYCFQLPQDRVIDLQVIDKTFAAQQGAVRYALKSMGDTVLTKSNVAPILVRAEPQTLESLTTQQRTTAQTITVQMVRSK